jgi:MOSC domain-containing protein YiiM
VKILSVNVGSPREIKWKGKIVRTSIFKRPVTGAVRIAKLNLDGDKQSDLKVHGGAQKAVYAYPMEHYAFWREVLPDVELTWGAFGENLTIEGLLESGVRIGDCLRVGSAQLVVTQPRLPCFKLGIRLGREDVIDKFFRSERSGFYLSVVQEGVVSAGDSIELLSRNNANVTVTDVVSLYGRNRKNRALLGRVSQLGVLPSSLRGYFQKQLDQLQ